MAKGKVTEGQIRVIAKLPNSEQSYKGKVKTHNYINRQISQQPENCENRNDQVTAEGLTTGVTSCAPGVCVCGGVCVCVCECVCVCGCVTLL
jgi:hypothetical protein